MKDLKNNVKVSPCAQQALSGTTNVDGAEVDMKGFQSCMFSLCLKTVAATGLTAEFKLQESDVSGSGFVDVADANDLIGEAVAIDQDDDDKCFSLGYVGYKRYVRAVLDVTANDGTDVISIQASQSHADAKPVEGN